MKNITFILSLCTLASASMMLSMKRLPENSLESLCTKKLYVYRSPKKQHKPFERSNSGLDLTMNLWGSPRKDSSQTEDYDMDCIANTLENTELEENYGKTLLRASFSSAFEKISALSSPTKVFRPMENTELEEDLVALPTPTKTLIKFFCKTEGCSKAFTSQGYLDNHMQRSHTNKMQRSHTNKKTLPQPPHAHIQPTYTYTCTTKGCNKLFVDPYQLTEHMNMHTYIQPSIQPTYTCTYTLNDELPNDKKSFACTFEECGKSFAQKSNLTSHMRTHTGEKPFACPFEGCNKSFTQFENVTSHMRTHTGEKPFACTVAGCDKSFAQKSNLTAHILTHTGEKYFACTVAGCDESFADQSNLNRHKRTHTGDKKSYPCTFEGCGTSWTSPSALKKHKLRHTGENPYACTIRTCNKSFSNLSALEKHKQTHSSNKKVYPCTFEGCDESFTKKMDLIHHMTMHTGKKLHPCTFEGCGKSYTTEYTLNDHIKQKHDPEGYNISWTSTFTLNPDMQSRAKQSNNNNNNATTNKNYICSHCDQSFINLADLNKHKQERHMLPFFIPNNNTPTEPLTQQMLTQQNPYEDTESNLVYK